MRYCICIIYYPSLVTNGSTTYDSNGVLYVVTYVHEMEVVLPNQFDSQLTVILDTSGVEALGGTQLAPFITLWVSVPSTKVLG